MKFCINNIPHEVHFTLTQNTACCRLKFPLKPLVRMGNSVSINIEGYSYARSLRLSVI